jgi:hypothetical protein
MIKKIVFAFVILGINFYALAQIQEVNPPAYIKTIEFKGQTDQSQLPIINLGDYIDLSFDALNGKEADFYYKLTHCNFDWTPSNLSKNEYIEGYDDIRLYNYENSVNTLQIYSHYYLTIPNDDTRRLTKSGNYLLSILNDDGEVVFTRKFMVVENNVGVQVAIKRARDIRFIENQQVVQFTINAANFQLINPKQTVRTLVLQNHNLKTAITNLNPQYTLGQKLVYKYDQEAAFWAGNEFLRFDNKDVRSGANGIRYVELTDIYNNYLYTDIARKNRPYTYYPDINGNFVVRNIDSNNPEIEADYVRMHFSLQYEEDLGANEIHIYGSFNNWNIDNTTKLSFDKKSGLYKTARLFKQGFYNYRYVVVKPNGTIDLGAIGGNFWQTENEYTVLVYYRDQGARYDRIIGVGNASSTNISNN